MNYETKIHLSQLEKDLIENKEWILTKHAIINKVYELFGTINEIYKDILQEDKNFLSGIFNNKSGKISKGENYLGLPYVILDYPAFFSKENIFAVRTMFWWGNFISISLHLSGKNYQVNKNFSNLINYLEEKNFFICVNESEWEHSFEPSNYIAVKELDTTELSKIEQKKFLKISKKIKLNEWDKAAEFLEKYFREIIEFLHISFPSGETTLSLVSPKAGTGL